MTEQIFYVGIDIDDTYAVVSFYTTGMKEPETLSMVTGSEIYQIPVSIARKEGIEQWVIGEEAEKVAENEPKIAVNKLFQRAFLQEEIQLEEECYLAEELFLIYLKMLIGYAGGLYGEKVLSGLAISIEDITPEKIAFLFRLREKLGIEKSRFWILDRKSSFYYFIFRQQESLWRQNVCLYDYRGDKMTCLRLERTPNTRPQLIMIEESQAQVDAEYKDAYFFEILQMHMKGHAISSAYLVGNEFDGNWMKNSLAFLCRGKRAFIGKNLYAKGACYAALTMGEKLLWPYVYFGEHEIKVNVSLKVKDYEREGFFSLLDAGERWYEAEGHCEVILDGSNEIDIWLQFPDNSQAWTQKMTLEGLSVQEKKTTRLHICAKAKSDREICIQVMDMGFGEIVKSSGMSWEYLISV